MPPFPHRSHVSIPVRRALLACCALAAAGVASAVNVSVNATQTVRTVDERVFGLNAVMWDGNTSTAGTISMLQAAGVRVIRIPGGSASDAYHWQKNKGDNAANPPVLNNWTWAAGFDSFARLITGIGSQAFVTVNYGSGTEQQAAAWVAYANASSSLLGTGADVSLGTDIYGVDWHTAGYWSALRAAAPLGGDDGMNFLRVSRAAPYGLKYWEIGNECYGTWEQDIQAVAHDGYTYANRAKSYLTMMKAVDPTIKVGVVADVSEDSYVNGHTGHPATNPRTSTAHNGWTPVMLATLKASGTTPDFLIYHRYEQAPGAETDAGLLQKAKTWPADAAALRQQLTDYMGASGNGVELCITENNSVYTNPGKQSTSVVDALYLADSVGNVLQTEFNSLVWWDLRNGQDSAQNNSSSLYGWRLYGDYGVMSSNFVSGSSTLYDAYPAYYVMKLLQYFARNGDTVVQATSDSTLLSVFAAKHSDGSLRLLVINKDPANTITPNMSLTGITPADTATVYSYGIPQDNAAHVGSGSIDVASATAPVAGTSISSMSFAPYSATVVVIGSAPSGVHNGITYNATTFPSTATAGATLNFTYNVTNTGTHSWGANHYLVVRDANNTNLYYETISGVAPGGSTTVSLQLTAPVTPGSYTFYVQGLEQNVAYFSARATLALQVNAPSGGSFTADFNGDGRADILWSNTSTGDRYLWLMNGGSLVTSAFLGTIPPQWTAVAGDFDGDSKADILWSNSSTGDRYLWLMNGGAVAANVFLGTVAPQWSVAIGDFNGDGKADILWTNTGTGDRYVWLMNGGSVTGSMFLGTVSTQWLVAIGDFNGDGKADLLWSNTSSGDRYVWLMNGTSVAGSIFLGTVAPVWTAAAGDFNGDGKADILWSNSNSGDRYVWLMNGGTVTASIYLGTVAPQWTAAVGDLNGDGKADLVWSNSISGDRYLWLMNGGTVTASIFLGTIGPLWLVGD
jgi:alpha-N-arabinofuranosidase